MTTPQELFESLQPLMERMFSDDGERWLAEANKRLLGRPRIRLIPHSVVIGSSGDISLGPGAGKFEEATGLHKYGDNHLRAEDFLVEPIAELLDAIIQAGPLCHQRLALGIEKWPRLKQRFVRIAIGHMFKALAALEAARGEKG